MSETMKMPALAVVGPDRRIVRSTEAFRLRYENAEKMCEKSPELDRVLTGDADMATLTLGDLSVEIEAVTDDTGLRQAMLSLPSTEPIPAVEPPASALRDAAEESPAMVWVKDMDGRYLFANTRYLKDLKTSEQRLMGHTDRELRETETVDGPRLRYADDGLKEPLQLEYTVPAIDRRPALAVFRFALRDEHGEPVATCGVAAPVAEVQMARDEVARLMQLERWNRLDPIAVRAELLEQWHVQATSHVAEIRPNDLGEAATPTWDIVAAVRRDTDSEAAAPLEPTTPVSRPTEEVAATTPAPPPTPPPTTPTPSEMAELLQTNLELARKWAERAQDLQDALEQAQTAAARASEEADRSRTELEDTRRELEALRAPASAALQLSEELGQAVAAERERGAELEQMLERMRSSLTDFESVLDPPSAATPRFSRQRLRGASGTPE